MTARLASLRRLGGLVVGGLAFGGLAGCAPVADPDAAGPQTLMQIPDEPGQDATGEAPFNPEYQGIETRLLDDDLVAFRVRMRGARTEADVAQYAECAAVQYALIRDYGYVRHLRTQVERSGGVWRAEGVFTISQARPSGLIVLEAEPLTAACKAEGIPTV